MKNTKTMLIGMLVAAVALSALITPATAQFVHPRGIYISTYPQDIVVFYGSPGNYEQNLGVWIEPPWLFVDGLTAFTSVTLTLTLSDHCLKCNDVGNSGNLPTIAGANSGGTLVIELGAVTIDEADNGALLQVPITFVISSSTARGFYLVFLSAQATAADGTTFLGWDQIPVSMVSF